MKEISYKLNEVEVAREKAFREKCNLESIEKARATMSPEDFNFYTNGGRFAYHGATGGGFSYIISPGSLGSSIKIRYNSTGQEEDITDYSLW